MRRSQGGYEDEEEGDELVFRCSAVALGGGAVAAAGAAFGCANDVLIIFAPELSYLLLAPATLITLLGAVGICAARRHESKVFRAQLAVFLTLLAVTLAAAGAFGYQFSATAAAWLDMGCTGHNETGMWVRGGRLQDALASVDNQYIALREGWEVCRAFDPLVYDLSDCGARAVVTSSRSLVGVKDAVVASAVPLFGWFQRVQLRFVCGGFCDSAVPLFGLSSMRDTLRMRPPCADKASQSVELLGLMLGVLASLVCVPILCAAMALFCGAQMSDEDYDDYDTVGDDADDADDHELKTMLSTGTSRTASDSSASPARHPAYGGGHGQHDPFSHGLQE